MLTATPAVSRLLPWTTQQGLPQPERPSQWASSLSGSLPTPTSLASPPPLLRSSRMQMPSKPALIPLCHAVPRISDGRGTFNVFAKWSSFPFPFFLFLPITSTRWSTLAPLPLAGLHWPCWLPGIPAYQWTSQLRATDVYWRPANSSPTQENEKKGTGPDLVRHQVAFVTIISPSRVRSSIDAYGATVGRAPARTRDMGVGSKMWLCPTYPNKWGWFCGAGRRWEAPASEVGAAQDTVSSLGLYERVK